MNYKPEPSLLFKTLFHKYSTSRTAGERVETNFISLKGWYFTALSRVFYFTFLKEYFPQKEIYLHINQSCLN